MWRPPCPYETTCRFRVGTTCCMSLVQDPIRDCGGKGGEEVLRAQSVNFWENRHVVLPVPPRRQAGG
jgi:hypothetical protein